MLHFAMLRRDMNLNELHKNAESGDRKAEGELFQYLSERFEQFANRRIWDKENAKEVAQEALMLIAQEYKSISLK